MRIRHSIVQSDGMQFIWQFPMRWEVEPWHHNGYDILILSKCTLHFPPKPIIRAVASI